MPPRLPTRAARTILAAPASSSSALGASGPARSPSPTASSSSRASSSVRGLHIRHPVSGQGSARRASFARSESRGFHTSAPLKAAAKNPYDVLGVAKDASAGDIKKAYYALAKKWHPDSSTEKNAAEKFHEIQNAYDILSDDSKRQAYDRYGAASTQEGFDADAFARGGAGGFGGFQDFGSAFGGRGGQGNASDLFEQLFGGAFGGGAPFGAGGPSGGSPFGSAFGGGGGPRARQVRGDDLEANISIPFVDACEGTTVKVTTMPVIDCKTCTGSGLKPGEKKSTCTACRGTGQQAFQVQGMFMASTCPACHGTGTVIPRSSRCGDCDGVGRVKERREVDVEIPAGIEDGMKIKMPGDGDMPISGQGPPGDLYVRVNVLPSQVFHRQGTNLYHDAKVPLQTALLGGRVRVPTLEGDVEVRIREGTQYGQEAVLKGRGVKSLYGRKGERGDLVVSWKVQVPRSLSAFQKKIFQAYADDVEGRNPNITFGPATPPPSSSAASGAAGESGDAWTEPPHPDKPSSRKDPRSASSSASASEPLEQIDPDANKPHGHHDEHSVRDCPDGVTGKMAHALGGALGWAEKMLGKGKEGHEDKEDEKKKGDKKE